MSSPFLLSSNLSTYTARCGQCKFSFSAPATDLQTFLSSYLQIATEFRLINGVWQCGHCHHSDPNLITITHRQSYRLFEGSYPAWVIIDTRGYWTIETYFRDKGPESKSLAFAEADSLNKYEGYTRWIVVKTTPAPKTLRRNPDDSWRSLLREYEVSQDPNLLPSVIAASRRAGQDSAIKDLVLQVLSPLQRNLDLSFDQWDASSYAHRACMDCVEIKQIITDVMNAKNAYLAEAHRLGVGTDYYFRETCNFQAHIERLAFLHNGLFVAITDHTISAMFGSHIDVAKDFVLNDGYGDFNDKKDAVEFSLALMHHYDLQEQEISFIESPRPSDRNTPRSWQWLPNWVYDPTLLRRVTVSWSNAPSSQIPKAYTSNPDDSFRALQQRYEETKDPDLIPRLSAAYRRAGQTDLADRLEFDYLGSFDFWFNTAYDKWDRARFDHRGCVDCAENIDLIAQVLRARDTYLTEASRIGVAPAQHCYRNYEKESTNDHIHKLATLCKTLYVYTSKSDTGYSGDAYFSSRDDAENFKQALTHHHGYFGQQARIVPPYSTLNLPSWLQAPDGLANPHLRPICVVTWDVGK